MCTLLDGWYTFSVVSFTKVSISSGIFPSVSRLCDVVSRLIFECAYLYSILVPRVTLNYKFVNYSITIYDYLQTGD